MTDDKKEKRLSENKKKSLNSLASDLINGSPRLEIVVEFVHENFTNSISPDKIATVGGTHSVHFSRGKTVAEYIRPLSIQSAQNLIFNSDLTFTQIAFETGLVDQNHFSGLFKRFTTKPLLNSEMTFQVNGSPG